MSDNKLFSGGLIFALSSLATYSYHIMNQPTRPRPSSYTRQNKNLSTIIEEHTNINSNITPNNTPENEITNNKELNENIEKYMDNFSLVQKDNKEEINKLIENLEEKNKQIKSKTNSITMSSFLELYNTNSQTNTDDLEFTKLEHKLERNVYGTLDDEKPFIKKFDKDYHSEELYESDESSDVEISYYSENEIYFKSKSKKKNFLKKIFK